MPLTGVPVKLGIGAKLGLSIGVGILLIAGIIAGDHYSDEGFAAIMERWNADVKASVPSEPRKARRGTPSFNVWA